jgi:branched-chain amino acid transport system ATP-binding protein
VTATAVQPALACAGVRKRFGALVVLDGIDLRVGADEALGIVGPNGAGKTTLLDVLAGEQAPTEGTVQFAGEDVTGLDAAHRCRKGIGRSHQVPRPFGGMTVFENALVGALAGGMARGSEAEDRALDVLDLCDLLPHGNRRAEELGLLARKRLELARALATDPQVLLLDEIAGGLTDAEGEELVSTVQELRGRGIAIVWIEHIVHILVQVCPRLLCMSAGKVLVEGPADEVMRDPAVIEAYLGSGVE